MILIKHVYGNRIHDDNMPRIVPERAAELDRYRVMPGDIVFSRVGSVGRIGLVTEEQAGWLISGQMLRLRFRSKEVLPSFLMHAISSDAVLTYFDLRVIGTTRDSINTEILSAMPLPLPPLPEQRAIADFLDCKTRAINDLIQKKERLIELLQEKWQTFITQAVTKGLDPTVPMKDSGIEGLGEIPAHWEVLQLRKAIKLQRGFDITKNEQQPGPLWVIQFRSNLPRFVYYKLLSMNLERLDTGSANPTLNRNLVHPIRVSWPPVHEQSYVVDVLDALSEQTKRVSKQILTQLDRLREYRQTLISAAVTGKIDVTKEMAC